MNKSGKLSLPVKICLFIFAVYFAFVIVNLQIEIKRRRAELDDLQLKIESQYVQNTELKRVLEAGDDNEYVERIARERLGFAYPDEKVLIDISGS